MLYVSTAKFTFTSEYSPFSADIQPTHNCDVFACLLIHWPRNGACCSQQVFSDKLTSTSFFSQLSKPTNSERQMWNNTIIIRRNKKQKKILNWSQIKSQLVVHFKRTLVINTGIAVAINGWLTQRYVFVNRIATHAMCVLISNCVIAFQCERLIRLAFWLIPVSLVIWEILMRKKNTNNKISSANELN